MILFILNNVIGVIILDSRVRLIVKVLTSARFKISISLSANHF